jgi:DNA-directed RNA polymerase III subunit RPC6
MVFAAIDDAGGDGIWSQTLHKRLNMHDKVLRNAIKFLMAKNLIKPFKNVEHPNKKMFIKASIQPSERATGGPWFTDQTLDEAFIDSLQRVIFDHIKTQSSYNPKQGGSSSGGGSGSTSGGTASGSSSSRQVQPRKGVLKGGASQRKRSADMISEDAPSTARQHGHQANGVASRSGTTHGTRKEGLLPYPAGYTGYPTVRDIARYIHNSGIVNNTVLGESDVQQLVNVLVYDGLVESIRVAGKLGYRTVRIPRQSLDRWAAAPNEEAAAKAAPPPRVNGYTEVPCGKCPVFDLCEEGGPVSASNCVYFKKWLGLDLD